jgi:uncharacterized protein YbaR (Trm112 family)
MRNTLFDLLACPACHSTFLELAVTQELQGEIWEGTITCSHCGRTYPIRSGMPHLYLNDASWRSKAKEAAGWVAIHQQQGIYEQVEEAVDLQIPYYPDGPWPQVARSFDLALSQLNLTGRETILDLGAGRGWAAKQFALRGCRVVALDVVADENVGLGRGHVLMTKAGTYFDRLIADGEKLPFRAGVFDLVFCAAALHHSSNLPLLLRNIGRVTRAGGRLCAINEPVISFLDNEKEVLARDSAGELALGINETRPNILGYLDALSGNGFTVTQAFPAVAYDDSEEKLHHWAQALGAIWPHEPLHRWWRLPQPVRYYLGNRLRATMRGMIGKTRPPAFVTDERSRSGYAILLWAGNELFLLATKQP